MCVTVLIYVHYPEHLYKYLNTYSESQLYNIYTATPTVNYMPVGIIIVY